VRDRTTQSCEGAKSNVALTPNQGSQNKGRFSYGCRSNADVGVSKLIV
jgi:hypothetical protein